MINGRDSAIFTTLAVGLVVVAGALGSWKLMAVAALFGFIALYTTLRRRR